MPVPKSIKIGVQYFSVVERDKHDDGMLNDGAYGYTLDDKNLIVLDRGMPESKKKVTLFHEILHAARMAWENQTKPGKGASFEDWEHYFIGVWETTMILVLRDNPELVKWLLKDEPR